MNEPGLSSDKSGNCLLVVDNPKRWKLPLEGVSIIRARDYLAPGSGKVPARMRVFNLCDSYAYQSLGYYVSLLAEARGHQIVPSVATLRDFRSLNIARALGSEIDEIIQANLKGQRGSEFSLPVYFGQTVVAAHAKLGAQLYRLFPAPLLRADFTYHGRWLLSSVVPLALDDFPPDQQEQIAGFAASYFRKRHQRRPPKQRFLYDLAILVNPAESTPPSNPRALQLFAECARETGFHTEFIQHEDAGRICEFDALFIRETTAVNHPTYQLARLAHAEGLVVIDDPWSILRCANKVYLAELLSRARLPAPPTRILTAQDLVSGSLDDLEFPQVLKLPDGAFSRGLQKVASAEELLAALPEMLRHSDLILTQKFTPSDFDWRIGVLDHQALFACKYYMARGHWQIYNWSASSPGKQSGKSETLHVEFVPPAVIDLACKATRLIGDGFYGVDIKQIGKQLLLIEINDNPSVDAGVEDAALGRELYRRVARSLRRRIELARS